MSRQRRLAASARACCSSIAIPFLTPSSYIHNVLILTFLVAVIGSGWNVMSGFTGYVSLGHSMFIGVGGLHRRHPGARWEVSPFLVAPLGGIAAALVALAARRWPPGGPAGAAFVIVTFAMLELLGLITRNWSSVTGGSQGLLMPLPDWDVRFYNWPFYYALLALLLISVAMTAAIRRSKFGLGLVAIRDDEDKAAGIGVVAPAYKALAFMASAVLVGMAGAVYGYYVSFLTVGTMFDIVLSMQVVLVVLLGGRGTVWGPVLGAFIVVPLAEVTNTSIGGMDAGRDPAAHVRRPAAAGDDGAAQGHHSLGHAAARAPSARRRPSRTGARLAGAALPRRTRRASGSCAPTRGSELLRVDGRDHAVRRGQGPRRRHPCSCRAVRSPRSSARTARARRRCSTSSTAPTRRRRATSYWPGRSLSKLEPHPTRVRRESAAPTSCRGSSTASPCSRTSRR